MKLAPTLMIQGTASSVGKSILTTALCRVFKRQGLRVLPFKSQNMALNAFVTPEGGEIGRAQAVQADACGVAPHVDMNPILLKPEGDAKSQVVVLGKAIGRMSAVEYHAYKPELKGIIAGALERLRSQCDVLVIEGAGSPAEINLKPRDIVNMHVAHVADASVLLVGDIDRGGVFASLVGTMELLDADDRARVKGFLINRFRGDVRLLGSGLDFLKERTGVPTLGVIPYMERLRVADEDSVSLDHRTVGKRTGEDVVRVAAVRTPRISNYDDFAPLEHEPQMAFTFTDDAATLLEADLVILPGSKATVSDLAWLRCTGLAAVIQARVALGRPVLGVCGGCQMLGSEIADPHGVESSEAVVAGLGVLPIRTVFQNDKRTAQTKGRALRDSLLARQGDEVRGYEIHAGRTERLGDAAPMFTIVERHGKPDDGTDGAIGKGPVYGTMLHGIFDSPAVRRTMLDTLRATRGLGKGQLAPLVTKDDEFDRMASVVEAHIDRAALQRLIGQ